MGNVNLSWPSAPSAEQVTAYKVYEAVGAGGYILRGQTSVPSMDIADLPAGVYHWKVSAVNLAGEGPQSNIADSPGLPSKPGDIVVTVS